MGFLLLHEIFHMLCESIEKYVPILVIIQELIY